MIRVCLLPAFGGVAFPEVADDGPALHNLLGGFMEVIRLPGVFTSRGLVGLVDEEGALKDLEPNMYSDFLGRPLAGPVIIVKSEPPEMVSLSDDEVEFLRDYFNGVVIIFTS
jgi:hypothetical protein